MEDVEIKETEINHSYGLVPQLAKNDKKAKTFIWTVSVIVFVAVAMLSKVKWNVDLGFNPHLFARANALINSTVTVLLLAALYFVEAAFISLTALL